MHTLRTQDRDRSMTNWVSFHRVPMPRGIAFAIRHIENRGAPVDIFSACRIDSVVKEHNTQFGTNLSGQGYLFKNQNRPGFNPANPPDQTSHCLYADEYVRVALAEYGIRVEVGNKIPWFSIGLDLADHGKSEDVSDFLHVAKRLGYKVTQPYKNATREKHHVIFVQSPLHVLESMAQISKERTS